MGGKFSTCFGKRGNRIAPDTDIHRVIGRDSTMDIGSAIRGDTETIAPSATPETTQVETKFPVDVNYNEEEDEDCIDVKKVTRSHLDLLAMFEVPETLLPGTKQRRRKRKDKKLFL
ncbi:hypothetical protein SNE40_015385 [Patella caerulea]|uniref:Uncharacterized protein n=1 Tax=Patella caerulea TaxID=87958 RepID=A0AAN8JHU6_PATCE